MGEGKTLSSCLAERELSTLEEASLLNVFRPFLIKQTEAGLLPYNGSARTVASRAMP